VPPFQGLGCCRDRFPRALPWAFELCRPFGPKNDRDTARKPFAGSAESPSSNSRPEGAWQLPSPAHRPGYLVIRYREPQKGRHRRRKQAVSPFQGSGCCRDRFPRALPWAFELCRPFGTENDRDTARKPFAEPAEAPLSIIHCPPSPPIPSVHGAIP